MSLNNTVTPFDNLPDAAYVRLPTVAILFACSHATVWRRVKDRSIPSPKKLSAAITAWNVGELRAALKTMMEKSHG